MRLTDLRTRPSANEDDDLSGYVAGDPLDYCDNAWTCRQTRVYVVGAQYGVGEQPATRAGTRAKKFKT